MLSVHWNRSPVSHESEKTWFKCVFDFVTQNRILYHDINLFWQFISWHTDYLSCALFIEHIYLPILKLTAQFSHSLNGRYFWTIYDCEMSVNFVRHNIFEYQKVYYTTALYRWHEHIRFPWWCKYCWTVSIDAKLASHIHLGTYNIIPKFQLIQRYHFQGQTNWKLIYWFTFVLCSQLLTFVQASWMPR